MLKSKRIFISLLLCLGLNALTGCANETQKEKDAQIKDNVKEEIIENEQTFEVDENNGGEEHGYTQETEIKEGQ